MATNELREDSTPDIRLLETGDLTPFGTVELEHDAALAAPSRRAALIAIRQRWGVVLGIVVAFVYGVRGDLTVVLDAVGSGFSTKVVEHEAADTPESAPATK